MTTILSLLKLARYHCIWRFLQIICKCFDTCENKYLYFWQSSEPGVLGGMGGLPNQRSYGSPSYPSGVDLPGYGGPMGRQPPPGLQLPGQHDQDPHAPALTSQLSFGSPKMPIAPSGEFCCDHCCLLNRSHTF